VYYKFRDTGVQLVGGVVFSFQTWVAPLFILNYKICIHSEPRNSCEFRDCQVVTANDIDYLVHKSARTEHRIYWYFYSGVNWIVA